ncbi:MAG: 1-phosphofructokinase family hexose kinase [Armatimonadetes bacterium]|nr:1-phosphofructokinase family hexose kinase [Armatimonadota bacterium]
MFLTVTLNPALDKTLVVDRNHPQETLRATGAVDLAGGKGVNVGRALLALGAPVRAFMPLGGHAGAQVVDLARQEGLEVASVPVSGQTRLALTVRDRETGQYWHYLEPGPRLEERELSRIREGFLWALDGCHTVLISGSLPSPAAASIVPWMVRAARERGLRVALDSFSPLLRAALEAGPWLAKPNRVEAEQVLGVALAGEAEQWAALERLAGWGIRVAVLTLGREGALALVEGERYRIEPPTIVEVNDLGSGDALLAGLCWAAQAGRSLRECLAWGAACGAANAAVWDPGGIRREAVEALLPESRIVGL